MKTLFEFLAFIALGLAVLIYHFNGDAAAAAYAVGLAIFLKLIANDCKKKE